MSSDERPSDWTSFVATFYNEGMESTGKQSGDIDYGITASGRRVQSGVTIAVDPRIIALGSIVEVKYSDGRVERRRADDTGGMIKGNHIDVYKSVSEQELQELGRQKVFVRVIRTAS